jgi:hypothetical protein
MISALASVFSDRLRVELQTAAVTHHADDWPMSTKHDPASIR